MFGVQQNVAHEMNFPEQIPERADR